MIFHFVIVLLTFAAVTVTPPTSGLYIILNKTQFSLGVDLCSVEINLPNNSIIASGSASGDQTCGQDQGQIVCFFNGSKIDTINGHNIKEGIYVCHLSNNENFLFAIYLCSGKLYYIHCSYISIMIDDPMLLSLSDYHLDLIQNEALLYFRAVNGPINSINCSFNDQEMQPAHFIQTVESSYSTLIKLNVSLNQSELWYNCSISNIRNSLCSNQYLSYSDMCSVDTYFKGI